MGELSVKLKICDREYPMKVAADDEAKIRRAGKLINEKIRAYREAFGIDDKQDLLAMVAFDSLVESMKAEGEGNSQTDEHVVEKISHLNAMISKVI